MSEEPNERPRPIEPKPLEKEIGEKIFIKLEKLEKLEHKEKPEKAEFKEKPEKFEHKEKPEKFEHKEKPEKSEHKEYDKGVLPDRTGKDLSEGPLDQFGINERLSVLEQSVASLQHFITKKERPDLSRGALSSEPDAPKPGR